MSVITVAGSGSRSFSRRFSSRNRSPRSHPDGERTNTVLDTTLTALVIIVPIIVPALLVGIVLGSYHAFSRVRSGSVAGYHYFAGGSNKTASQIAQVVQEFGIEKVFRQGFSDEYVTEAVRQASLSLNVIQLYRFTLRSVETMAANNVPGIVPSTVHEGAFTIGGYISPPDQVTIRELQPVAREVLSAAGYVMRYGRMAPSGEVGFNDPAPVVKLKPEEPEKERGKSLAKKRKRNISI